MKKRIIIAVFTLVAFLLGCSQLRHIKQEKDIAMINSLLEQYGLSGSIDAADVLLVGQRKGFRHIQTAVDRAKDGDVIVVLPGIYEEAVEVSEKTISIIGQDRNECILTHPNGDYFEPPIEMGSGLLANMTIYAQQQERAKDAIAPAYAIHIDFNISKNSTFDVIDVNFINDSYQTVGIGLRQNFTLHFQNCLFECKTDNNAFYCHDDPIDEESKNQQLIVENCYFINNGTQKSTILMQSQESPNSEILCQWKDNIVENTLGGQLIAVQYWDTPISPDSGWYGMSFWTLSDKSAGNNLNVLNHTGVQN